jgi:hypothetical protein
MERHNQSLYTRAAFTFTKRCNIECPFGRSVRVVAIRKVSRPPTYVDDILSSRSDANIRSRS